MQKLQPGLPQWKLFAHQFLGREKTRVDQLRVYTEEVSPPWSSHPLKDHSLTQGETLELERMAPGIQRPPSQVRSPLWGKFYEQKH
ncbi:uncharacterized protein LOC123239860 isoform X2 [Gracilinanus agilis]|uniref:uncharacterized protein LOC123239860 isoform X2 n=1 Tax=Gracilinanus agilis TaxID=191870 RepID=UPI001CFE84F9|nr:uncharacterized protein LOC123239860 isoform X2 [Gracilinanus agilis]